MLVAVALTAVLMNQQADSAPSPALRLTSYEDALQCAGLTQAASELEGGESPRGRILYDAALYWSLSTIQAARVIGRDPVAAEQSMARIRINAVRRISNNDGSMRDQINACVQKAPSLRQQ